jgi:hypothetical protein
MREKSGVSIPTIWSRRWVRVVVDTLGLREIGLGVEST